MYWGLVVIATTASATYILGNAFATSGWQISGFKQLIVLLLFTISFLGIFKISDPLLHFIIFVQDGILNLKVLKGENHIKTIEIQISDIEALKFAPHTPRSKGEAMFDFSTSYHLMWKSSTGNTYKKLIELESVSFTLKVEDITKIIRHIRKHNRDIYVPDDQARFFGL